MSKTTFAEPAIPADLSPASRDVWPGLVDDLRAVGNHAEVDLTLLADVLRARERLEEVSARLAVDGPVTTGSKGQVRPHPLLLIESTLRREIASGLDRLGLSPARRDFSTSVVDGRIRRAP